VRNLKRHVLIFPDLFGSATDSYRVLVAQLLSEWYVFNGILPRFLVVCTFNRYADRAKAIKVKASTINSVTSTALAIQLNGSSKPGGGSQTPTHQLRKKLGDTEASREKLEEEVSDVPKESNIFVYCAPSLFTTSVSAQE